MIGHIQRNMQNATVRFCFLINIIRFVIPLCYFLQWGQLRRRSPTTPSSWGSVCGLTWSRLAAFHCSRSGLQRGISVSSSHIHQHISHVHYAVYQWLWLMDIECVHVCVYIYLFCLFTCPCVCVWRMCVCYVLGLLIFFLFLSIFASLFVHIPPSATFIKVLHFISVQMVWISAECTHVKLLFV